MTSKTTRSKAFPAELRERAVRLVRGQEAEHATRAAAIRSVAAKVGCHAETLRLWLREEQARIKALERENRELRQANEILRKASAFFAQAELDRPTRK